MNISHSGELGDVIWSLPAIRALGGGSLFGVNRPWTRPEFTKRIAVLKRLLESQDYVHHVGPHEGQHIDLDISPFRRSGLITGQSIPERIARFCRATPDLANPWIMVEPDSRSSGRIVINQCERWTSWFMPWKQIVDTFKKDILFVGLKQEHNKFQEQFGKVSYQSTNDLYEVASLIKGSELFIGNQSSANSIAEAMKHRKILAACLYASDCLFKGDHATYCIDGSLSFEACGKSFHSEAVKFMPRNHSGNDWDKPALLARVRQLMIDNGI